MTAALVAVVIAALAVLAVAYPLVGRVGKGRAPSPLGPSHLQELLDRREALLAALKDLENDRGLGNIDEGEYRHLRMDYELQAVAVLKALDARADGLGAEVEKMVLAARGQPATGKAAVSGEHCARCGAPRSLGMAACAVCGFPGEPRAA